MKKICILFPGIGYTVLKPLLYYTGKYAAKSGYEVVNISYENLPKNIKGDKDKMKLAFDMALAQSKKQLSEIDLASYDDILFIGKSIGTAVAAACGRDLKARYIYLTPLESTYKFTKPASGIAFHGKADPWADTAEITRLSQSQNIPLYTYENANHSLETGDVETDIQIVADVLKTTKTYI